MEVDDNEKGYRWETEYEKTWEAIRETEGGLLQPTIEELVRKAKRGHALKKHSLRLGIMRHLYIVLDCSESMLDLDLKPSRFTVSMKIIESFLNQFFDQNPISQVGIITTSNKRSNKVVELNGSVKTLMDGLKKITVNQCVGEVSLQNSLEMALSTMKNLPQHTSKQVLIIMGSLTTCDPSDIDITIKSLVDFNVRVSVIGLSAEVQVCKRLARETKGSYHVILDEHHFRDLVFLNLSPPSATQETESCLIRMGFPPPVFNGSPSMCVCHLGSHRSEGDSNRTSVNFSKSGFFCPQCHSKYCSLPVECKVCGLTLVSPAHLARSYHHLFPIEVFHEIEGDSGEDQTIKECHSCQEVIFSSTTHYRCPSCSNLFCSECDNFIHESLHVCPGCASLPNASAS